MIPKNHINQHDSLKITIKKSINNTNKHVYQSINTSVLKQDNQSNKNQSIHFVSFNKIYQKTQKLKADKCNSIINQSTSINQQK